MRPSKKWLKMAVMYKRFAKDFPLSDFSDEAAKEMFAFESRGIPIPNGRQNGYEIGKKWMDLTLAMWKEDIEKGLLFKFELINDYPKWFLEKVGILNVKQYDGEHIENNQQRL